MARPPDPELKQRLLDEIVTYLAANGLGLLSLRPLAIALGTSPNRLVHHFGTKDQLVDAALARATEQQEAVQQRWLMRNPDMSQAALLRLWWKWMCASPTNLAVVRLGLEAATLEAANTGVSSGVREAQIGLWRSKVEKRLRAAGLSATEARIEASIVKATFTGMSIDLMASGDRRRLNAAMEEFLQRLETRCTEVRRLTPYE